MATIYAIFGRDGTAVSFSSESFDGAEEITLPDNVVLPERFLRSHRRAPDGSWEALEPEPSPELSPEEIAAEMAEAKRSAERAAKLEGISFEGVFCSATSADQAGLLAVLTAIQLQKATFQPTRFEFENGATLILHLGNYAAFMAVWLPFRQSFFRVD